MFVFFQEITANFFFIENCFSAVPCAMVRSHLAPSVASFLLSTTECLYYNILHSCMSSGKFAVMLSEGDAAVDVVCERILI